MRPFPFAPCRFVLVDQVAEGMKDEADAMVRSGNALLLQRLNLGGEAAFNTVLETLLRDS